MYNVGQYVLMFVLWWAGLQGKALQPEPEVTALLTKVAHSMCFWMHAGFCDHVPCMQCMCNVLLLLCAVKSDSAADVIQAQSRTIDACKTSMQNYLHKS